MKRTRRGALALIAGSSSLLAVETLGYSSGSVDRSLNVDVVDDERAYLGLDEESPNDGQLFDSSRLAPAVFDIANQFPVPIEVSVALEAGDGSEKATKSERADEDASRDGTENHQHDNTRPDLRVGTLNGDGYVIPGVHASLAPGAQQSRLAIDLNPCGISRGELATERSGTLLITAKNSATDAEDSEVIATVARSFVLESNLLARISVPWSDAVAVVREHHDAELVIEVVDCPSGETRARLESGLRLPGILRLVPEVDGASSSRRAEQEHHEIGVDSTDEIEATVERSMSNEPGNGGGPGESPGSGPENGSGETPGNGAGDGAGNGPPSTSDHGDGDDTESAEDNETDDETTQQRPGSEPYVELAPDSLTPDEESADVPTETIRIPFPTTD
ncbi:hypothetical protein [Natrialba sp. SSL1]|uniref:hypothetical protein n=1 Tax=Natrialba sp. SSL1 TaxID=1869245 RepID=UPI0008F8B990|nr:hypothetical protein [Natrialba sp. SSL1]OIB58352.1 hypothetical protein BBD46_08495 [Natrialba sp. SSL1]